MALSSYGYFVTYLGPQVVDSIAFLDGYEPTVDNNVATKAYADATKAAPTGTSGQVQYNNNGAWGASSNLAYSSGADSLTVPNTECLGDLSAGGAVIGGGSAHASAALTVNSTSKGLLVPRLTTSQRLAISPAAEGMVAYDTTLDELYSFQNGAWAPLSAADAPGGVEGSVVFSTNGNFDASSSLTWNAGASTLVTPALASSGTAALGATVVNGTLVVGSGAGDESAALAVNTTSYGLRFPGMTTAQRNAISTPAEGLMVYDTSVDLLYVFAGGQWTPISSVAPGTAGQVLFNDAGLFAGSSGLTFDGDTSTLTATVLNVGTRKLIAPKLAMYRNSSSTQAISSGMNKLTFNTTELQQSHVTRSGSDFTANVTGLYHIHIQGFLTHTGNDFSINTFTYSVQDSGGAVARVDSVGQIFGFDGGAAQPSRNIDMFVQLTATTVFSLNLQYTSGVPVTVTALYHQCLIKLIG